MSLSLGALLRYLRQQDIDTVALLMRIEDVIVKSLVAVAPQIAAATRSYCSHPSQPSKVTTPCCFELFGYDILIDDTLRPWLMEVNLSPSLACDSPLDWKVKSHMMCDLLTLVGVVCRDPAPAPARKEGPPGRATAGAGGGRSSRAQNASSRTLSRQRTMGNTLRGRPASASTARQNGGGAASQVGGSGQQVNNAFTRHDAQLVRRSREEYRRRGGWIRIFPTEDSWALYSALFAQPISLYNLVLHQRLFPQTHRSHNSNWLAANAQQPDSSQSTAAAQSAAYSVSAKRPPLHSSSALQNILSTGTNDPVLANAYVNAARRCAQFEGRLGEPRSRLSADEATKIWRSLMPEVSRKCHTFGELAKSSLWKARCIREYSDSGDTPSRSTKASASNSSSSTGATNSSSNATASGGGSGGPTPVKSSVEQVPARDRIRRSYTSYDIPAPRPPYAPQSTRAPVANDPRRIHLNVLQNSNTAAAAAAESGRPAGTVQPSLPAPRTSSDTTTTTTPKQKNAPVSTQTQPKAESGAARAAAKNDSDASTANAAAPPVKPSPAKQSAAERSPPPPQPEERSRDSGGAPTQTPNMQELASKLTILEARTAFTRYLRAIQRRFLAAEAPDSSVSSFRF